MTNRAALTAAGIGLLLALGSAGLAGWLWYDGREKAAEAEELRARFYDLVVRVEKTEKRISTAGLRLDAMALSGTNDLASRLRLASTDDKLSRIEARLASLEFEIAFRTKRD